MVKFLNPSEDDEGELGCEVANVAGVLFQITTIDILSPPLIEGPKIENLVRVEGDSTELDCSASGDPDPVITWFYNEVPIPPSFPLRFVLKFTTYVRVSHNTGL